MNPFVISTKAAQHSVHPTGGSLRVFRQFAWLEVGSGKMALSHPTHPRVTHPVSPQGYNMEDLKDIVLNILALLAILLLVVELIGYSTWNKRYFTFGIPIFVRTIPTNDTILLPPSIQDMEARCPSSFWGPSIQFREIGQGEYAFRDGQFRFFSLAYPPVMHGYLAYDADNRQIRVTGFVILMYPLVIFGAISSVLSPGIALIVLGVFFGIPYLLQAARFNAVANMAANFSTATYSQTRNAG